MIVLLIVGQTQAELALAAVFFGIKQLRGSTGLLWLLTPIAKA